MLTQYRACKVLLLQQGVRVLNHLACIMDGNRRWAEEQGLPGWTGHKYGVSAAQIAVDFCLENKISYLTLYAFSIQNFQRTAQELSFLFDLFSQVIAKEASTFTEKRIKVSFAGDRNLFPDFLKSCIDAVEKQIVQDPVLHITLLFCYGAQEEIVSTAQKLARQVQNGALVPEQITIELFKSSLWTATVPSPDLIVRTGFVHRLSNFLLFQAAYAELYFMDCFWPDITKEHLQKAVDYFKSCSRRFGK